MKNRTALFSGLALFLCFCLLTSLGKLSALLSGNRLLLALIVAEIAAFVLPTLLLRLTSPKTDRLPLRASLKISASPVISFTIFSGIALSIMVFLINYAFFRTATPPQSMWHGIVAQGADTLVGRILVLAVFVLISPICEELFLRGALFSAHEKLASTGMCIALSGVCFAMIHGSLENFIGPLLAGCLYAYLTYSFDCVWPAVLAHVINNLYFMAVLWLTNTYSAFGIWKYFPSISVLMLLGFLYLAFRSLEILLATDHIRRFSKREGSGLLAIVINPGFSVFLLAFAAKAIFSLF